MNRDEGHTSWATSTPICCSLWWPLAEDSKQQFKTTRWIREAVKIRQESQGVNNRDEGHTSWATSTPICCSLWWPLAEDSKQQFKTTRWIREAVKILQASQGVSNRDEGPTSWATSTTICYSLWWPLADNSKQQFKEDSSCCRNVTENFSDLFTVVSGVKCLNWMFTSTDEPIQEYCFELSVEWTEFYLKLWSAGNHVGSGGQDVSVAYLVCTAVGHR